MAPTHTKSQIEIALTSSAAVDAAIRILGENQTEDELRTKHTRHENDIGFSAAYGRVGTRFYEFVTGISTKTGTQKWEPKSLAHPVANRVFARYVNNRGVETALDYARDIALLHWKQLGALLELSFSAPELPTVEAPREKKPARPNPFVNIEGRLLRQTWKAFRIRVNGRAIWLPKSQVTFSGGVVSMPLWLAKAKGLAA